MEFVALDVETANADMSSICQIGLARFRDKSIVETWKTYIDPEDEFDPINISIHGITQDLVKDAPTIPEAADEICDRLSGAIVVSHTHFDRVALGQSLAKYGLQMPTCTWLDSARVTRRVWEQFAWRGYGLVDVCDFLGYNFAHHDALEDAKAAAFILLAAMDKSGLGLSEWLGRVRRPIDPGSFSGSLSEARAGNPQGAFHGEVVVFTGALSVPRQQAANMAAQVGCEVAAAVNSRTTMLVVGDQDVRKLAGHDRSAKHRKAEALIQQGHAIRILQETDFRQLVKMAEGTD